MQTLKIAQGTRSNAGAPPLFLRLSRRRLRGGSAPGYALIKETAL